jgi:hypothetical protein
MLRTIRTTTRLAALAATQRAAAQEAGVPLYLPAFAPAVLEAASDDEDGVAEADFGAEAEFGTADGDDDFY